MTKAVNPAFLVVMAKAEESLQGQLILDSGKLAGSYFDRSVILVCKHNESGTFGLILNKPMDRKLNSVLEDPLTKDLGSIALYGGGPVQSGSLCFLLETELRPEYDILPRVVLAHTLDEVRHHKDSGGEKMRVRAYAGYAGWTAGQLDQEMKSGCWVTHPPTVELVFNLKPAELWKHVLEDKGGVYKLMAGFPDDPTLN